MYPRKHLTGNCTKYAKVAGYSFPSRKQWQMKLEKSYSSKELELGKGKAVINSDCVNLMQLVIFLFGVCLFEWILNTAYAAWVISRPLLLWQNRMDFRWIILNSNSRTQLNKSSNEVKTNPSLTFWLSLVLLPQVIMHETFLPNESLALRAGWRVWSVSCCKYIV